MDDRITDAHADADVYGEKDALSGHPSRNVGLVVN